MSFVKVLVVDGNILTASLLLVTTFVELRVVAGKSRTRKGRPHAASGRPLLIHTHHVIPRSLSERHGRGMAGERHDMCESNTAALRKSNEKDTI
jgi:hypothetical protein